MEPEMEDKTLELMVSFGLDDYFLHHNIDVSVCRSA